MHGTVDVAVVGGGIVGCLVAREIVTRQPSSTVVVLDRDAIGSGATRRSAGVHFPRGATPRVQAMTEYSQDYYRRLRVELPGSPIRSVDAYVVSSGATPPAGYLAGAELGRVDAVPGRSVTLPSGATVWRCRGCHHTDVPALAQLLARSLRPQVGIGEGVRVTGVEPCSTHVALRLASGDTLTAGRVVLCPGPWLGDPAWRTLVPTVGARVKRVVALHLDRPVSRRHSLVVFDREDAFLLPLPRRAHWLFSYTCPEWDVDPDAPPEGLSAGHRREAETVLNRYLPGAALRSGRVFCDAYSDNGEPQIRTLDDTGRVVFAGAANGSGYRLAPAIARETADLLEVPVGSRSLW
ncbi:FAD-dependent oxidoreductase [Amycolatopsis sp. WAC 01376]|uniref:NAD(P)/FAD-dependent oxidoreductase n=1 Tax=Amycolatopsis sp. WAC 01376 TaxID=2203195 RepID=UPI000F77DBF3|nr:FAD-binding oxidoreductase [Amycolatopsis sp. WAC 01376]RSM56231.1 FAD-dependent oxidoreductase [Amycolatopsis sp. WAC 01376]